MYPKFAAKEAHYDENMLIKKEALVADKRDSGTHPTPVEALRWDFLPKGWFSEICMINR